MPALFRTKPVTVEAVQWTGDNRADVQRLLGSTYSLVDITDPNIVGGRGLLLHTAGCIATPRDWIVKSGVGQPRVVKADVFAATYEPLVHLQQHVHVEAGALVDVAGVARRLGRV